MTKKMSTASIPLPVEGIKMMTEAIWGPWPELQEHGQRTNLTVENGVI